MIFYNINRIPRYTIASVIIAKFVKNPLSNAMSHLIFPVSNKYQYFLLVLSVFIEPKLVLPNDKFRFKIC